jgi:hypothetical protein
VGPNCQGSEPSIGVELLHFARTLCASANYRQLEHYFIEGFGRLFDLPMSVLYTLDPWTGVSSASPQQGLVTPSWRVMSWRAARSICCWCRFKPHNEPFYNMAVMASMDEWLEHPLYTKVKYRHDIQAPLVNRDGLVGMLYFGTAIQPERSRHTKCDWHSARRRRRHRNRGNHSQGRPGTRT